MRKSKTWRHCFCPLDFFCMTDEVWTMDTTSRNIIPYLWKSIEIRKSHLFLAQPRMLSTVCYAPRIQRKWGFFVTGKEGGIVAGEKCSVIFFRSLFDQSRSNTRPEEKERVNLIHRKILVRTKLCYCIRFCRELQWKWI